jgi:hypothetical protein
VIFQNNFLIFKTLIMRTKLSFQYFNVLEDQQNKIAFGNPTPEFRTPPSSPSDLSLNGVITPSEEIDQTLSFILSKDQHTI